MASCVERFCTINNISLETLKTNEALLIVAFLALLHILAHCGYIITETNATIFCTEYPLFLLGSIVDTPVLDRIPRCVFEGVYIKVEFHLTRLNFIEQ